ncbi:MAG: hypothetical protein ACRCX8_08700 [Sarcina sp.]
MKIIKALKLTYDKAFTRMEKKFHCDKFELIAFGILMLLFIALVALFMGTIFHSYESGILCKIAEIIIVISMWLFLFIMFIFCMRFLLFVVIAISNGLSWVIRTFKKSLKEVDMIK